jgi:hypothetical protein
MQLPGRPPVKVKVSDKGLDVGRRLELAPGRPMVSFSYAGVPQVPPTVTRGPQIFTLDVIDDSLHRLDPQPPGAAGPLAGRLPPPCVQTVTAVQSPVPS